MPFDISEIKKLPIGERLRIIDELWESIEAERNEQEQFVMHEEQAKYGVEEDEEESDEIIAMLDERWERYKRGESKGHTWEEVKQMLINDENERRKV
jgi:hypothetical protein